MSENLNKICSTCNTEKLITDFFLRKDNNKYRPSCKTCWQKNVEINRQKRKLVCPKNLALRRERKRKEELLKQNKKECSQCKEVKSVLDFKKKHRNNREFLVAKCKTCEAARTKKYQSRHKDRDNLTHKLWLWKNPERYLLKAAKHRAKKRNLPFNLELNDIIIPEYCPILGIKLERSIDNPQDCSPSIDQIKSNQGYIKGNVAVISYRANTIKNDGTIEEHEKIIAWMKQNGC